MICFYVYKVILLIICVRYECNVYNYVSLNIIFLIVNVCLIIVILVKVLKLKWFEIIYLVNDEFFIYLI